MALTTIRIVGSGLIGTSIGLALSQSGRICQMVDKDGRSEKLAQELVGAYDASTPDLVVLALPTSALPGVIDREFSLNPQAGFIDTGSIKTKPKSMVDASTLPLARFCPTHPMAGREVGRAESAQGDLFQGRPWIIDRQGVDRDVVDKVESLISICGGVAVEMSVEEHDRAVALVSHLAQLSASLLAKQLWQGSDQELSIAGGGLRDSTRIAGSDPELWSEIIVSNSRAIAPFLSQMSHDLAELISHLDDPDYVAQFIRDGREGRARIPGKHGGKQRTYTYVPIVIDDKPGQLSLIFDECAKVGVNVEDLSIEHSPGQDKGLVTLALSSEDAARLSEHLSSRGWSVHPWRS